MRQTVKLTESELRRAIANVLNNTRKHTTRGVVNEVMDTLSGKQQLSELDYKTYMSAANKRAMQRKFDKVDVLRDVANKEYGYNADNDTSYDNEKAYVSYTPGWGSPSKGGGDAYTTAKVSRSTNRAFTNNHDILDNKNSFGRTNLSLRNINTRNGKMSHSEFNDTYYDDDNGNMIDSNRYNGTENYFFDKYKNRPYSKDFRSAYDRAREEGRHFANGDYEYQKGKGWQLKK